MKPIVRKYRLWITFFVLPMIYVLLTGQSGCDSSAERNTRITVSNQQEIYNTNQPLHLYQWSLERQIVQQLYDYRVQRAVNTWSIWYSQTGVPIDGCPSKGFGIPYNTSMTNGLQPVGGAGATIQQAEPNGLFPGGSTDATWVMCVEPDGSVFPQYVEPLVVVYTWSMEIVKDQDSRSLYARRVGDPDPTTKIDLTQKKP